MTFYFCYSSYLTLAQWIVYVLIIICYQGIFSLAIYLGRSEYEFNKKHSNQKISYYMSHGVGFLESTAEEKDLGAVTYFGGDSME